MIQSQNSDRNQLVRIHIFHIIATKLALKLKNWTYYKDPEINYQARFYRKDFNQFPNV